MNPNDQDRIATLLKKSMPPVGSEREPARDLWPAVLRRLDERPVTPWFDWALLAALAGLTVAFPASIPVLLYYL
jgi:hypothetical protein